MIDPDAVTREESQDMREETCAKSIFTLSSAYR